DELGDLLLQIALHAQVAREEGTFDAGDVARRLNEKLIRPHPHVFAGTQISSGGELLAQWERIKREEQGDGATSLLGGVPRELPALFAAERMLERAARVKLEPPRLDLPLDIDDEEFLGGLLFDIVAAARDAGFDAETALRNANERFAAHVARVEARATQDRRALESYAADEMRRIWEETACPTRGRTAGRSQRSAGSPLRSGCRSSRKDRRRSPSATRRSSASRRFRRASPSSSRARGPGGSPPNTRCCRAVRPSGASARASRDG